MCEWGFALQVTGTLLKGYKARFKGAPISSTVNYLKQYVSVSVTTSAIIVQLSAVQSTTSSSTSR